ncbi:hypothetical protein MP638_000405 [Amoeboaphelidium occidentale]|nr:hypothetical protein MP638_000405 [Amoeboaphelidium occidentale]
MLILRTVRDFLTAALPPLQWDPREITSNKTTVPAEPRTDETNLSAWDTALLRPLLKHFGYELSFLSANNLTVLDPDIVCVDTGRRPFEVVKIVIEIKTPWALPTTDNTNLVERFNEELQTLIENNMESTSSTGADFLEKSVSQLLAEVQSATKETKHIRLITQIYAYMTANHLMYGMISNYEHTFFLRRMERQLNTTKPILQVTRAYNRSEFVSSSLVFSRPIVNPRDRYQPSEVSIASLFFLQLKAKKYCRKGAVSMFKLYDSTKSTYALEQFHNELRIYRQLEGLQDSPENVEPCIPLLRRSMIGSGFVLILELTNCGTQITEELCRLYGNRIKSCFAKLHARGVVHTDVARRNILVDSYWNAFLVDFGRSRLKSSFETEQQWQDAVTKEIGEVNALVR